MSVIVFYLSLIVMGFLSTLPLGPTGAQIVFNFALDGMKKGIFGIMTLLLVDLIYTGVAFSLKLNGLLDLANSYEVYLKLVFSVFLISYGTLGTIGTRKENHTTKESKESIFLLGLMNPTILLFYIGLIIGIDTYFITPTAFQYSIGFGAFLTGSSLALLGLGLMAQANRASIAKHLKKLKFIVYSIFILAGSVNITFISVGL